MDSAWSRDFSYAYLRKLLRAATANYAVRLFRDARQVLTALGPRPQLLLRHDVDIDLAPATAMARIEHEFGVAATYMVMLNSPTYRLDQGRGRSALGELAALGHEIGLHFDFASMGERESAGGLADLEGQIDAACRRLEDLLGGPVASLSFHRPLPQLLHGPLTVAGRINAYAAELTEWYLSDSKGCWREGEPLPKLLTPQRPLLQLLIHPIWWGEVHGSAPERLEGFFQAATADFSPREAEVFDAALAGHLSVRRRGAVLPERSFQ